MIDKTFWYIEEPLTDFVTGSNKVPPLQHLYYNNFFYVIYKLTLGH